MFYLDQLVTAVKELPGWLCEKRCVWGPSSRSCRMKSLCARSLWTTDCCAETTLQGNGQRGR